MEKQPTFKLEEVKMSDIALSETNTMLRSSQTFTGPAWDEFVSSIRDKGVLQPILVRPKGKGYELVCGERRFRAMQSVNAAFKHRNTIPCKIQEMTDDEAINAQLIENIEREDIPPMMEAEAYDKILKANPVPISELAARFAKSEQYITRRLALLTLTAKARKEFESERMTLGHALLICRLSPHDQDELIDDCEYDGYGSVKDMDERIKKNVLLVLSKAGFKKDDVTLNPKAGACTTCPKRSGANPMLFGDIKNQDTCFDSVCYEIKKKAHLIATVKHVIENEMDILFIRGYGELYPEVTTLLEQNGIKPLKEYTDYNTSDWTKKKTAVNALIVSGSDAGQKTKIFLVKQHSTKVEGSKAGGVSSKKMIEEEISIIKHRLKRAEELDDEKCYVQILDGLKKSSKFKKADKITPIDILFMRYIICSEGYVARRKGLDMDVRTGVASKIKSLASATDKEIASIAREIMLERFSGQATNVTSVSGQLLWKAATDLKVVDVDKIVAEQQEVKTRRLERAKKRIADLKKGKATVKPKKAKVVTEEPDDEPVDED